MTRQEFETKINNTVEEYKLNAYWVQYDKEQSNELKVEIYKGGNEGHFVKFQNWDNSATMKFLDKNDALVALGVMLTLYK